MFCLSFYDLHKDVLQVEVEKILQKLDYKLSQTMQFIVLSTTI